MERGIASFPFLVYQNRLSREEGLSSLLGYFGAAKAARIRAFSAENDPTPKERTNPLPLVSCLVYNSMRNGTDQLQEES